MLSSIRLDGTTACMTIEGATDTEVFQSYVREVLCPTLRPGDVVVMDNLSPHKHDPTLSLIEQTGASVRFLPAYSPDLNPIEKMWSKVKQCLRSAEARTREDVTRLFQAM
jgi:transposase